MPGQHNPLPNFRHLRAFRDVARAGSISRAVDKVHLSQPAITQALAKLEEFAGTPLFERQNAGMSLTPAGALYAGRVSQALDLVSRGAKEATKLAGKKGSGSDGFDRFLTTSQLKALVAVARAGSFSLAARQAGVAQPTLHRAARDVERLSGLTLFEKSPSGITLAPSGDVLVTAIKLALSELEQGRADIAELLGGDTGQLIVGSLPLPRATILPTAINAFCTQRPNARVSIVEGPYDDLLKALRQGELDILAGALRDPSPADDVVQESLFTDLLAVVARIGHPLSEQAAITREELIKYQWVVSRPGTPTRRYFDRMFPSSAEPMGLIESSSLLLTRNLLLESDRLALISAAQIHAEEEFGLLQRLPVSISDEARPIGIAHRRDWRPTKAQEQFLNCLRHAGEMMSRS